MKQHISLTQNGYSLEQIKKNAKKISKSTNISYNQALNQIVSEQTYFSKWTDLKKSLDDNGKTLLKLKLNNHNFVFYENKNQAIVATTAGKGKTAFSLTLAKNNPDINFLYINDELGPNSIGSLKNKGVKNITFLNALEGKKYYQPSKINIYPSENILVSFAEKENVSFFSDHGLVFSSFNMDDLILTKPSLMDNVLMSFINQDLIIIQSRDILRQKQWVEWANALKIPVIIETQLSLSRSLKETEKYEQEVTQKFSAERVSFLLSNLNLYFTDDNVLAKKDFSFYHVLNSDHCLNLKFYQF